MKKRVVLAYSGGLDTSYCGVYLTKELGYEVYAVIANTGGFSPEEINQIEKRAYEIGCSKFINLDVADQYYQTTIKYMVYGNMLKNRDYPISVSSERIVQAISVARYAKEIGADYLCHGSTGAGNDQIRFDSIFGIIAPQVEVIALIREQQLSRQQEIDYLKSHNINLDFEKAQYSINKGLWGTSVGGKETLTSNLTLPEEAYTCHCTKSEDEAINITISFEKGELSAVNGQSIKGVEAITLIEQIASQYAIGRGMHVGDTIVGIKGRVGFEAAAAMLIIKSHATLEKHTLSKWQQFWKDQVSNFYCNNLHEGLYFDPVMRDIEQMLTSSQTYVNGVVEVRLMPYRFEVIGIESPNDLLCDAFGSYGEMNKAYTGADAEGFGKIYSLSSKIFNTVNSIE